MNAWMLHALADSRRQEMWREGGGYRHELARPAPAAPAVDPTRQRWPRMRRQVGYALVEAGLHLLATGGPATRG